MPDPASVNFEIIRALHHGRGRLGKGRSVVTYSDGTWTARERPGKVRAAQAALRELASNRLPIQTIQAAGTALDYPAWAVFGPDEITLNLG